MPPEIASRAASPTVGHDDSGQWCPETELVRRLRWFDSLGDERLLTPVEVTAAKEACCNVYAQHGLHQMRAEVSERRLLFSAAAAGMAAAAALAVAVGFGVMLGRRL